MAGDDAVVRRLGRLVPDVDHPVDPRRTMGYRVDASPDGTLVVLEEGDVLVETDDHTAAADAVYVRMYRRAFELASLAGWVRLHAVTADVDGRRVLVVGPSGVGKTTLALALLAAGHRVDGDESVLVRDGQSLAVPRGFHVKAGAEGHVDAHGDAIRAAPLVGDVRVVDPHALAPDWRLDVARVDDVVVLSEPGSTSVRVEGLDRPAVLQTLVAESFVVTESKSDLVQALATLAAGATARRITRGPVDDLVHAVAGRAG